MLQLHGSAWGSILDGAHGGRLRLFRLVPWRLVPGWIDGREVLAVFRNHGEARPDYFIELTLRGERVAAIRDFRYVSYTGQDAEIVLTQGATP